MLYYSGVTRRVGDVDAGNTVTDFLELERQRGITIQSAAITFHWPLLQNLEAQSRQKTVNLIDTPGHQDFRFEVERCLPILDGAVCILDSVEGVEAHTERVWASAHEFKIPRIIYCNKLDREGASFKKAVLDIGTRLKGWPLVCQIPWWERDKFVGVVDVIDRVGYRWVNEREKKRYDYAELKEKLSSSNPDFLKEIDTARQRLVEGLADFDEAVMDEFLSENPDVSSSLIKQALRRVIQDGEGKAIPVFAGSSFRHIGVELLMDAVTTYLPHPAERPDPEVRIGNTKTTLAKALESGGKKGAKAQIASVASVFKVAEHPKEGVISYVRVYYGTMAKNASAFNTHILAHERPMGLLQISASKTDDIPELSVGQIGALRGLKKARTGDTLITTVNNKPLSEGYRHIQIRPPEIPAPVAFLQITPYGGNTAVKTLETALDNASREDPSLRWSHDSETEIFTLQGMGKLHLSIAQYNLRQKYTIDAEFGPLKVDYKECLISAVDPKHVVYDRPVMHKAGKAACTVTLEPMDHLDRNALLENGFERDGNIYTIEIPESSDGKELPFDKEEAQHQLLNGAIAGLARGPRRASPIHSCHVRIVLDTDEGTYENPTGGHFSGLARTAVQGCLRESFNQHHIGILEPVMMAHITCPEAVAGTVQHDLTAGAGGVILQVSDLSAESTGDDFIDVSRIYAPPDPYDSVTSLRGKKSTGRAVQIVAKVPYKELLGMDENLRSKTAGRHTMTMHFDSFARVVGHREKGL